MSIVLSFTATSTPAAPRLYVRRDSDGLTHGSATGNAPYTWAANADGHYILPTANAVFPLQYESPALTLGNSVAGTFAFYDGAKSTGTMLSEAAVWETDVNGNELAVLSDATPFAGTLVYVPAYLSMTA